jgi:hypothetical protein
MADNPEMIIEQIADMLGARVEVFESETTGEVHVSIETDDQGVSGYGPSREAAFKDLVRSAREVGWTPPTPIT